MYKDIKDVMEKFYSHLNFDEKLYKALNGFRTTWMQKTPEYIEFLGGKTIGVQSIAFSTLDEEILFNDILNVDINELKTEVYKVKDINPSWEVSSNPVYASLLYIMHRYLKSDYRKKEEVCIELNLILSYKVIGSLISHYYDYPTTEDIAKTVIELMSNQFSIKKEESWQALFTKRTSMFMPKRGIKYKQLEITKNGSQYERMMKFDTLGYIRVIGDAQGGIRSMIKNSYEIMLKVTKGELDRISSTSLIEEHEDGLTTKDITERPDKYILYIRGIYNNHVEFVNDDLIHLLTNVVPAVDEKILKKTLVYLSEEVEIKPNDKDDFLNISILRTINYINSKGINSDYNSHIMTILKYMKNYWSSSSVKEKDVIHIKSYLKKQVQKATKKKTNWVLAATSVGVLLYIFLRSIYRPR